MQCDISVFRLHHTLSDRAFDQILRLQKGPKLLVYYTEEKEREEMNCLL